jgi:hypothetical protein
MSSILEVLSNALDEIVELDEARSRQLGDEIDKLKTILNVFVIYLDVECGGKFSTSLRLRKPDRADQLLDAIKAAIGRLDVSELYSALRAVFAE